MAESTLTKAYDDIRKAIGRELYGGNKRDPNNWNSQESEDVTEIMEDGYLQILQPPADVQPYLPRGLQGQGTYRWNWLSPISSIVVWPDTTYTASGDPSGGTTLTATAASTDFVTGTSMVGRTITFTTSSNTYTVASVTSATVLETTTSMSGETSGDTFSIASTGDYRLPDEFGGIDGVPVYNETSAYRPDFQSRNPMQILEARQSTVVSTGPPYLFAIKRLDTHDATVGQRWELMVFPEPDAQYTLYYTGPVNPDMITATNKYALGGMPFSLAFKHSCLDRACKQFNDNNPDRFREDFLKSLAAAIVTDSKNTGAESVGRNTDGRDRSPGFGRHDGDALTTYNGTLYEG